MADNFYTYYLFLLLGGAGILFALSFWNQYRLTNRISEYYEAIGAFMFSISSLAYFVALTINPNENFGWPSIWLYLIIPAIIFNAGIAIRAIVYGFDNRPPVLERLRLIFGIPKDKRPLVKSFQRKDLLYSGITGYVIALVLSLAYGPKDFLIIVITVLSELFLIVAPLKLVNKNSDKGKHGETSTP